MYYREIAPPEVLQHLVLTYWVFEAPPHLEEVYQHRVMPDGCVQLVYLRQPQVLHLVGPRLDALVVPVHPGAAYWGVRFRPGAAGGLLGLSCVDVREVVEPAMQHIPRLASAMTEGLNRCTSVAEALALFTDVLTPLAAQANAPDALVQAAVDALMESQGQLRMRTLAEQVGLSERQLQRRFRQAVGLTPKQFARIRRFRSSVGNMLHDAPNAWGRVAAEQGYADQAHLTREFQDLYGAAPTEMKEKIQAIEHRDVNP